MSAAGTCNACLAGDAAVGLALIDGRRPEAACCGEAAAAAIATAGTERCLWDTCGRGGTSQGAAGREGEGG